MNLRYWIQHPTTFVRRAWHLVYERTHPAEPFMAPRAIRFLDSVLPRDGTGLEWGSGRSTQWFAVRLSHLVSIEHQQGWYEQVSARLREAGLSSVDYRLIQLEHPEQEPTRPQYDPAPKYVSVIEEFPDSYFDFVEVDGHYRQACARAALRKVKPGGHLLVDDTNWIPIEEWGVPSDWSIVHQSVKINTTTSIWRKPS